jgi:hypothetical protein
MYHVINSSEWISICNITSLFTRVRVQVNVQMMLSEEELLTKVALEALAGILTDK